jgi:hypothetical protein
VIQTAEAETLYRLRLVRKDVGVAILVLVALSLGWLLRAQVSSRTTVFQDKNTPFTIAYPATWTSASSLQDVLLKVEDPNTTSAFKTALTVTSRDLDPQSPPTLQTLVDRRIAQVGALTAFHFLSDTPTTVGGAQARLLEYAYVVQPIDAPRRASVPVVVHAREYVVVTKSAVFYITLGAPDAEYAGVPAQFDEMMRTVRVQ